MNWQAWSFSVTQFVGFSVTVIFGIEAVVKLGIGALSSIKEAFKQDEIDTSLSSYNRVITGSLDTLGGMDTPRSLPRQDGIRPVRGGSYYR